MNKKTFSLILMLALGAVLLFKYDAIIDQIRAWRFSPTAEVATIEQNLQLTDAGQLVFRASRPLLEPDRDLFNQYCSSHRQEVSVLGCYTNRQIYTYHVPTDELPGILESTTAHELLHAVWARLSVADRQRLEPHLNTVYDQHRATLEKDLKTYKSETWLEELYVRSATQIADLPAELETHYAHYFKDQDSIAAFYSSYITPFNQLEQEITTLSEELQTLNQKIETAKTEYSTRSQSFSATVSEFNQCAATVGCFPSRSAFSARRQALVSEQNSLENLYQSIDADITLYNQKVVQHNTHALRRNDLENAINSNYQSEVIK